MANPILLLNVPMVNVGLPTLTITVPLASIYRVTCGVTVPEAVPTGDGAGSGQGLGSGSGGGDPIGFSGGGLALGNGGVGQGFGAKPNNYNQPSPQGSNATQGPAVSSSLSIVVNHNGSPVYTAPVLSPTQSALQFTLDVLCAASDTLSVVFSSSNPSDNLLNTLKSTVSVSNVNGV
jgi:hypothetical protein